ncbi:MAG: hypothetical protein DMG85_10765 [Acidobacteria bacterium]|nr:MAG: hypothetical protein DMG85_10765 [Acidobacteriota bacterium]
MFVPLKRLRQRSSLKGLAIRSSMNSWWAVSGSRREESKMKALRYGAWVVVLAIAGLVHVQSAKTQEAGRVSDRERLIGAWHLEHIDSPQPEGKPSNIPQPKGMLIYTRDGHMSVQLMYPKSANNQSNEYVQDGYEASFGSYEMDEVKHMLTHHVQGSITRDLLVGKDLPRVYQFTADRKLVIQSARPDEHWSVTWEHY